MALVTLLTDFGWTDYYVGAVKGTLLRLAPGVQIVDLSHDIPPGDVEAAMFLLAAAAPTFPPGTIHLGIVDPGVGSTRRLLATRTTDALFVAPDNGLLTPLLAGAEARSIERPDLLLPGSGSTFHGRDRFAPAAAFLARGGVFEALGPEVPDPVRLPLPAPWREADGSLHGRVAHIDRFGNLVTDIPAAWFVGLPFRAEVGRHAVTRWASHYAELPPGEPGLLPGSLGTLELAVAGASLAARWGVQRGAPVRIRRA